VTGNMDNNNSSWRRLEWGRWLMTGIGVGLTALGARGYLLRGHIGWIDAFYSLLMLVPAAVLLLLEAYLFQHAKLVAVMPLFIAILLVKDYPAFAVALGLALLALTVGPLIQERFSPK
jgi:hypothetical protein